MKKRISEISKKLMGLYKRFLCRRKSSMYEKNEKELSVLSPGVDSNILLEEYYTKKISNSILIAIVSVIIVALTLISRMSSNVIDENNTLVRNEYGNGNYSIRLNAKSDEYDYGSIDLEVGERRLTKSEYNDLITKMDLLLEEQILGENADFTHIDTEMVLPTSLEGFPFSVRWESSDYMLIHTDGKFGELVADEDGNDVVLRAVICYGELEYVREYPIVIYPHRMTNDEVYQKELKQAIEKENAETEETSYMKLPDNVNGNRIEWAENREPIILIALLGLIFTISAVWIGTDKDLKGKCEERDRQLLSEYSEFVSKLQLLLSSGLTIRGALERMAGDYRRNLKKGGKKKYAYEELLLCVKKLQDGMSEANCYEFFGNRCGLLNYKKLASLLVQNLRKGNEGLIMALAAESEQAFEERKAVAKRMGEEAQTKLLFPMIIMLAIVMIIIMIPAYMSFGSM